MLRYVTGETDDGLSGKEGTFLICSFWLVSALAIIGEHQRARDLMERLLNVASPLGLYAEELDADTGRHLEQMLSTPEIGSAMFISVNTVRTHVRHILHKLAVTRRNQAVRRARALGLL